MNIYKNKTVAGILLGLFILCFYIYPLIIEISAQNRRQSVTKSRNSAKKNIRTSSKKSRKSNKKIVTPSPTPSSSPSISSLQTSQEPVNSNQNPIVTTNTTSSPTPSPTPSPIETPIPTLTVTPTAIPIPTGTPEILQNITISPDGLEIQGSPTWLSIIILVVAGIIALVGSGFLWVTKVDGEKISLGLVIILVIAFVVVFFILGKWWNSWSAAGELQTKIEKAKEDSKRNVIAAPSAPASLNAVAISDSQINLSWEDRSNTEEGFKLERKLGDNGSYSQLGLLGSNITNYSDIGLAPQTKVYYRIKSYNSKGGDSGYSNETFTNTMASYNKVNGITPGEILGYFILPVILGLIILPITWALFLSRYREIREDSRYREIREENKYLRRRLDEYNR